MPAIYNLSDVFISYSRRDSEYVRKLEAQLREAGYDVWIDWEDIPPTADWWNEIQAGIEAASTFVFVISPDSVASEVCYREIEHAIACQKRLVPVLYREISDPTQQDKMHPSISTHNWVLLPDNDQFVAQFTRLIDAILTDLDYLRTHTRLLVRAREWELRDRDDSYLLSGTAVQEAQNWLTASAGKKPSPSALHADYVFASQTAQDRRQRQILIGVSVALVVSLALAALSFVLYQQAQVSEAVALERGTEVAFQAATSAANADIASTNEAEAFVQSTAVVNQAATSEANANIASTNEALALLRSTDVANQAATSDSNANIAVTNEALALLRSTEVANQAATSAANADIASTNEAEAFIQSTAVVNQAATSEANANIASTNEAEAFVQSTAVVNQASTSEANANIAATNAAEAARQADLAAAAALAAQGETALENGNTEFALLLGIEALSNHAYTWDAERILAMALLLQPQAASAETFPDLPADPYLSPNGSRLLEINAARPERANLIDSKDGSTVDELVGHLSDIMGAIWSPSGEFVATISQDATVRIWRASDGSLAQILPGHNLTLSAGAWSADNSLLATSSFDGTIRLWNMRGGGSPIVLDNAAQVDVVDMAFNESGDALYMRLGNNEVLRWPLWTASDDLLQRARAKLTRGLTDEEAILVGLPLGQSAPPPDEIPSCSDALDSRLYVGARGRVTDEDPLPLNVRVGPGTDFTRSGQVAPDQTFQVLEGPSCGGDNMAWFRIVYGLNARGGWIAEGDSVYFVEPIPRR